MLQGDWHKGVGKILHQKTQSTNNSNNQESEEYIKKVLSISPKYCIALSDGYVTSTMEFVEALHRLGYIKRKLDIEDIFNFRFVEKIHPENHHYLIT